MRAPQEAANKHGIERHNLRRAGGMQGRLIDPNLVIGEENKARSDEVRHVDIKYLFPTDNRIRYHKYNGDVYLKSYRKVKSRSLVRWSKLVDLEAAIRLSGHVIEAYDPKTGKEIEKTRTAISLVRSLSIRLQRSGLFPMDMQLMAEDAALELTQAGFINAQKEEKQKTVEKVMKAARLDSVNRVNPSRSRLILSHAWVDLIRELLIGKMTENKYVSIQAKLIRERELERFVLLQTASYIDELTRGQSSFEESRSAVEFKQFARQFLSNEVVKLKPYSRVAATARFLIMNTGTEEELEKLRKYIGDDAGMYRGTPPLTKLAREEQQKRLRGIKMEIVNILQEGEANLHIKTSERVKV